MFLTLSAIKVAAMPLLIHIHYYYKFLVNSSFLHKSVLPCLILYIQPAFHLAMYQDQNQCFQLLIACIYFVFFLFFRILKSLSVKCISCHFRTKLDFVDSIFLTLLSIYKKYINHLLFFSSSFLQLWASLLQVQHFTTRSLGSTGT